MATSNATTPERSSATDENDSSSKVPPQLRYVQNDAKAKLDALESHLQKFRRRADQALRVGDSEIEQVFLRVLKAILTRPIENGSPIVDWLSQSKGAHILDAALRQRHVDRISEVFVLTEATHLERRVTVSVSMKSLTQRQRDALRLHRMDFYQHRAPQRAPIFWNGGKGGGKGGESPPVAPHVGSSDGTSNRSTSGTNSAQSESQASGSAGPKTSNLPTSPDQGPLIWVPIALGPRAEVTSLHPVDESGKDLTKLPSQRANAWVARSMARMFEVFLRTAAAKQSEGGLLYSMADREYLSRRLIEWSIVDVIEVGVSPSDAPDSSRFAAEVAELLAKLHKDIQDSAQPKNDAGKLGRLRRLELTLRVDAVLGLMEILGDWEVPPSNTSFAGLVHPQVARSFWRLMFRAAAQHYLVVALSEDEDIKEVKFSAPMLRSPDLERGQRSWLQRLVGSEFSIRERARQDFDFLYEAELPATVKAFHLTLEVQPDLHVRDFVMYSKHDFDLVREANQDCLALAKRLREAKKESQSLSAHEIKEKLSTPAQHTVRPSGRHIRYEVRTIVRRLRALHERRQEELRAFGFETVRREKERGVGFLGGPRADVREYFHSLVKDAWRWCRTKMPPLERLQPRNLAYFQELLDALEQKAWYLESLSYHKDMSDEHRKAVDRGFVHMAQWLERLARMVREEELYYSAHTDNDMRDRVAHVHWNRPSLDAFRASSSQVPFRVYVNVRDRSPKAISQVMALALLTFVLSTLGVWMAFNSAEGSSLEVKRPGFLPLLCGLRFSVEGRVVGVFVLCGRDVSEA